jgi:group I intron endonuclease
MFNTLSIFNTIYNDAPQPWQIGFQDSAAPGFTGIVELHNTIFFYLIVICVGVFWVLGSSIYYFNIKNSPIIHKYLNHGRYVPIQKCFKFNNYIQNNLSNPVRNYVTLAAKNLSNKINKKIDNIKIYEDLSKMRKNILNENKGKSGIYMLTNKLNNKIYIGQSSDISNRFKNYLNLSYLEKSSSKKISRALIKYKYFNFSLTILEYCDKSNLLVRENFYINQFNPQYNIKKIAVNSLNSKQTEETTKIMSLTKIKQKNVLSVKSHKKSSIELMKLKALDRKYSKDIKLKISVVRGKTVNIYEKVSSEGFKLIGSFISARRAAIFLNISGSTVIKYMNSGEIFKNRYKFSSK